ncbi:carboxylesterase/lipase family protein [Yinghuangia soli]|uniref:Carboxylic ester hydrolase n=1 Tax=Yinghuangia soli TaxID=2908204 RepID=A0AA41PYT3_9ACTN|nr:carboxylesterase family protein [Yinghuangia soli]MCF2527319.1 carboxylesterase family protein [Yinghuangia soli]
MIVQTADGPVSGTATANGAAFKGVPYAAPPVGPARFRPPQPTVPWELPRAAVAYGPAAAQPPDHLLTAMFGTEPFPSDEDCLTLNIWTPGVSASGEGARPVMVWLHGGGFIFGSGRDPFFDGERLASRGDVVVVTVNYRLGAFGFLHLGGLLGDDYAGSGNLGLLDQVAALTWVRANIAAFGGDPGNVTVFGQSAGAMSVAALMAMPAAAGLFHKAVVQSGSGSYVRTAEDADGIARRIVAALGSDDPRVLLEASTAELIRAQEAVTAQLSAEDPAALLPFAPVVDGTVLGESPLASFRAGKAARIPLIVGANRDEMRIGSLFGAAADAEPADVEEAAETEATLDAAFAAAYQDPGSALGAFRSAEPEATGKELLATLVGESMFRRPAYELAQAHAVHTPEVWLYLFTWPSTAHGGRLGACHSLDLPFVFDNLQLPGAARFTGPEPPQALADAMRAAWTGFARTGNPGLAGWPAFSAAERQTMIFAAESYPAPHPLTALHELPLPSTD